MGSRNQTAADVDRYCCHGDPAFPVPHVGMVNCHPGRWCMHIAKGYGGQGRYCKMYYDTNNPCRTVPAGVQSRCAAEPGNNEPRAFQQSDFTNSLDGVDCMSVPAFQGF